MEEKGRGKRMKGRKETEEGREVRKWRKRVAGREDGE